MNTSAMGVDFAVGLDVRDRSVRPLAIKRFPISNASPQELRPRRNGDFWFDRLRQETPKLRMVPTEVMARAIPVGPDARAEPLNFRDEVIPAHAFEIIVHCRPSFALGSECSSIYPAGWSAQLSLEPPWLIAGVGPVLQIFTGVTLHASRVSSLGSAFSLQIPA